MLRVATAARMRTVDVYEHTTTVRRERRLISPLTAPRLSELTAVYDKAEFSTDRLSFGAFSFLIKTSKRSP